MSDNDVVLQPKLNFSIDDLARVEYFDGYLEAIRQAMVEDGVVVKSYFAWS